MGIVVTVCQEIFAANKFCGFRGSKGSAKFFIRKLMTKWLLTGLCTAFAYRNCLHVNIDCIQCKLLRLLVYLSLGSLFKL